MSTAGAIVDGEQLSARRVIGWWELRRLMYNVVLLVVGLGAIVGFEFVMDKAIPIGQDAIEPMALLLIVPLYGILANLCYTLGWVLELVCRASDPIAARRRGRWMFRVGIWFSCALTSLPFWYACVFWIAFHNHPH